MRVVIALLMLFGGVGLGLGLAPRLLPAASAATPKAPDDGGCDAVPANIDLATLQMVKRQLTAMRWEHNCVYLDGAPSAETITSRANEEAKTGWQLASATSEGAKRALLCFKRPRAPTTR